MERREVEDSDDPSIKAIRNALQFASRPVDRSLLLGLAGSEFLLAEAYEKIRSLVAGRG